MGLTSYRDTQVSSGHGQWIILRSIAETLTAVYVSVIAVSYSLTKQVVRHKTLTRHLTCLSAVLFVHWYFFTLGQYLSLKYQNDVHWTEYAALALTCLQTISAGTISTGPALCVDMSRLYNKAVTARINELGPSTEPNVIQQVSSSVIGALLYTYVYPMIAKTSTMDQVDIQQIPAMQARFRTEIVLLDSVRTDNAGGFRLPTFGPTISLLWTVWAPQWRMVLKG